MSGHAVVIVASTRAFQGSAPDTTGPEIRRWLEQHGFDTVGPDVVADGDPVGAALRVHLAGAPAIIITTGGTGVAPTDRTPEQTRPVLDLELPGIAEELRRRGAASTPTALLSRGLVGFAGETLVLNLPGSPGGVSDGLAVLDDVLAHLLEQRAGGHHGHAPR